MERVRTNGDWHNMAESESNHNRGKPARSRMVCRPDSRKVQDPEVADTQRMNKKKRTS